MNVRGTKYYLIIGFALFLMCGCSTNKVSQTAGGRSDVQKLLQMQRQKTAAATEVEQPLPAGFEATPEMHERVGDNYLRQGNLVSAYTQYQKSLEMEPGRVSVRYKVGMLLLSRGLSGDALDEFNQILAREPGNAFAYHGRAKVSFSGEKLEAAKVDLLRAIELKDDLWQAYALLGVVYDRQRQHAEAEKAYEKAAATQPGSAIIYNDLGVSRYLRSDYDGAADAFLKAFAIEPQNPRVCNNLGLTLYRLGRSQDAMEAFRRGGDQWTALNNIGYLALKDHKYDEAIAALEKAVEAKPSYYDRAQKNLEKARAESRERVTK